MVTEIYFMFLSK